MPNDRRGRAEDQAKVAENQCVEVAASAAAVVAAASAVVAAEQVAANVVAASSNHQSFAYLTQTKTVNCPLRKSPRHRPF